MTNSNTSTIKRSQKESLFLREISQLFSRMAMDDARLQGIQVHRVMLSPDKSWCTVFFFSPDGQAYFDEVLPTLILYKPSLRKSLAQIINSRYVPNLVFKYDAQYEKQLYIENLIEKVSQEDKDK